MLAAIVPRGSQTWFFKLVGPPAAVAKQEELFSALVQSVQFATGSDQPVWELPAGWRNRGPSGMRFATVEIDEGDRTLEITVIPLETMGELDEYTLANVNRWRGQLGLAPLDDLQSGDSADGSGSTRQFSLSDGTAVTLVNLIGPSGDRPASAPGFDMTNHPPIGSGLPGMSLASPIDGPGLTYETPAGWTAGKVDGMRRAAFSVADGERKVEITVINLPVAGGERLANVNRWRGQIGLDATTAAQLASDLQQLAVAGTDGDYIELVGPPDTGSPQAIMAVLADVAGSTWFFKLMGDADLAAQERERFRAFVQSVNFSGPADGVTHE